MIPIQKAGKTANPAPSDGALAVARQILDGLPVPAVLVDEEERIVFANSKVVHLFGFAQVELVGEAFAKLFPNLSNSPPWRASTEQRGEPGSPLRSRSQLDGMRKDGSRVLLEVETTPLDLEGRRFVLCAVHAPSGATWEETVGLLNEAQRIAKIGSWMWDAATDRQWWSEEMYRLLQLDPHAGGRPDERFFELIHPHDRRRVQALRARTMEERTSAPFDARIVLPDGSERIVHVQGEVIVDDQGRIARMYGTLQDVTESKATQTALQLTEMRYREAQQLAKIGNFELDLTTNTNWWSEELYNILEEDPERYLATPENFIAKLHPDDRPVMEKRRNTPVDPESLEAHSPLESRILLADGRQKIIEQRIQIRLDEDGQAAAVIGTIHDITERRTLEQQLRESEARYASTVELAAVGIVHVDQGGRFMWANQRLCDMLGYSLEELQALTVGQVSHPEDVHVADNDRARLHAGEIERVMVEKRYLRKDGQIVWVRISSTVRQATNRTPLYDISMIEDITARKIAEERIRYLATHDELTNLPNRTLFGELLGHAIETAKRYSRPCALLFIDLDRFKIINDSLGHEAGDALLKEVAGRLQQCVRKSDVVARLGGDEFLVLLEGVNDPSIATLVAKKVLSNLIVPINIKGQECRVTASIGIATCPLDAQDAATLMKHADMAMYRVKEEGKNNYQIYSPHTNPTSVENLVLEGYLAHALERQEFTVQYQPRVDITTGAIKGAEALLRWWNPEIGTVSPAHFIPLAEDSGLIVPIGKWVLRTACEQNMAWQKRGLRPIVMSVNVSPRQFKDATLLDDIAEVLRQTGMPPELLELEITERMIIHDVEDAAAKAAAIKDLGVRLAIDDFGTGYSSLSQLKCFPVDTLKVDRSFVRDIPNDPNDMVITQTIIALGKALGVAVVAEGVETPEQHAFLRDNDCDEVQGYLFGKPCHPDSFAGLLSGVAVAGSHDQEAGPPRSH